MSRPVDLDPDDWDAFRAESHRALDEMIDFLRDLRQRPVWTEPPPEARERFTRDLPQAGRDFPQVLEDFDRYIKPYATGNIHPMFMGWAQGAGTPVGMIAEMLAAGMNSNCGGRNHIAIDVERQIAKWMAQAFGFPQDASGIFVTGASMANFFSLLVARDQAYGESDVRLNGLGAQSGQLIAYASREAHNCVRQAMELAGLGARHLRLIPSDANRRLKISALRHAIAADRAAGFRPFLIVGTAGTVDVGAIDPLDRLADVAHTEDMWFHVDGAFGALAALSRELKPLVKGLERADSVAFDFHKWLHAPYDAGFFLVRDPKAHKRAFAANAAYLSRAPRGLAAGDTWPCDLGPDLSRGFRALKTWFTIETFGAAKLAECIEQCCRMAKRLEAWIDASDHFVMRAPVALNIVCFAVKDDPDGSLAREIVMELHERGEAAPSLTILDGAPAIRAAILNHRTHEADIDAMTVYLDAALRRARKEPHDFGALVEPHGPGKTRLSAD
ncbi:pyridoxal phosphate-dependent decarboxylase family protein [Methylocystis echinoides]|uniref:Cytochrome d ubiquinol oxidase subunit I n=1 Tax=Methylocystis echinoides TaxID=29468 RepID=A0A9W6GS20_9HYPH|nr:pyridoxal-dependent decarboxylase [Methylocystis echinoides]GLI91800.1 cytochrome d ubiquinol oxidase subunit I [Methylocystis echinoides]